MTGRTLQRRFASSGKRRDGIRFRSYLARLKFSLVATCAGLSVGCNGAVDAPPPGEHGRKASVEAGRSGAASIEELRETYKRAHLAKDMRKIRPLCVWNVGVLNADGSRPWYRGEPPLEEAAMTKLIDVPLQDVEFLAMPGRSITYRNTENQNGDSVSAEIHGKLLLITEDGRRLDPCFIVLNYYGRFHLNVQHLVALDALDSFQKGRPAKYICLPIDSPSIAPQ